MTKRPKTGGDLVTWVWVLYFTARLVAALFAGPMSDHGLIREIFWLAVPVSAQVIVPVYLGCFPEQKLPPNRRGVQWAKWQQNKPYFLIAALMGCGSVGLSLATLLAHGWKTKLAYSLVASTVLCLAVSRALPKRLVRCNLYMFLASAAYVGIDGPLDYWYTASKGCVPDGPHFDMTYYLTYSSIVGSIFGALGIMVFQTTMSKWRFRSLFWVTTVLRCAAAFIDIIIVKRWNLQAGVPDKVRVNFIRFSPTQMVRPTDGSRK
jgi:MFS family permease